MKLNRPRFDLRRWLIRIWDQLPFVRRRGGPELAGVREPRRPRPPFRPPQAMAAEPETEEFYPAAVRTLIRPARRWWQRRQDAWLAWRPVVLWMVTARLSARYARLAGHKAAGRLVTRRPP